MKKTYTEMDELKQSLKKMPAVIKYVEEISDHLDQIPVLFAIIHEDHGAVKYNCERIIQKLSERQPLLIYPYFDAIAELLDSHNNFIKWGAIVTLSNLAAVDDLRKFDAIYNRFFGLINDQSMITAGNVIGNAWKIVLKDPAHEKDITERLLRVSENTYINKGKPSPECKNILIGAVIDCFSRYFEISESKDKMIEFADSQRENTRKTVAKRAAKFLKKRLV